jgi:hypothetical protein
MRAGLRTCAHRYDPTARAVDCTQIGHLWAADRVALRVHRCRAERGGYFAWGRALMVWPGCSRRPGELGSTCVVHDAVVAAAGSGAAGAGAVAAQHLRGGPAVQLHQVALGAAVVEPRVAEVVYCDARDRSSSKQVLVRLLEYLMAIVTAPRRHPTARPGPG